MISEEASGQDAAPFQDAPSEQFDDTPSLFGRVPNIDVSTSSVDDAIVANQNRALDANSETDSNVLTDQAQNARVHNRPEISQFGGPSLIQRMGKDADDPSSPSGSRLNRHESTTLTTLSRLFAVKADVSPNLSRNPSQQVQTSEEATASRDSMRSTKLSALPDHLYTRGLLTGRHSDITVHAFGQQYRLHRLILDQAPFFSSALSEPWLEAQAKAMTIKPEDIDDAINQGAFELALKRLYGRGDFAAEDRDPIGMFATGCWLELPALVDSAVESMLRQMTTASLSLLIKLVTRSYYGRAGDKILASAKCMLCRDGWRMPIRCWDGIPGEIIREIVGGDGFFIDGEWDRWVLATRILNRRLKAQAQVHGLVQPQDNSEPLQAPDMYGLMAVRFDTVYRRNGNMSGRGYPDHLHDWIACYTHPDVEPLLVLLDEGIHYVHLEFEQLQRIRKAQDCFGLPIMSENVINNALWQQIELRQRIINAGDDELEIGLSMRQLGETLWESTGAASSSTAHVSQQQCVTKDADTDAANNAPCNLPSGSWDGNGRPRKFWIPTSDCNIVMGGHMELGPNSPYGTSTSSHAIQPGDVQWITDFSAITSAMSAPSSMIGEGHSASDNRGAPSYTHFPPFRFSAEFPSPRSLRDKKRVYSRTVFYAGSLWNIYIQKVVTSRSKQLGVYLHRAKEHEAEDLTGSTGGIVHGSVGDRISAVERGFAAREERRQRRHRQRMQPFASAQYVDIDDADSSGSAGDHDSSINRTTYSQHEDIQDAHLTPHVSGHGKSSQTETMQASPASPKDAIWARFVGTSNTSDPRSEPDSEQDSHTLSAETNAKRVPALPTYVDTRSTIRTYFKIYSPSRGGRMLSVYESAPDQFNFSQSWGWKSSNLMLDEGFAGEENEGDVQDEGPGNAGLAHVGASSTGKLGEKRRSSATKGAEDGNLRFMVVIGNI
jgi:hypothetical protein